MAHALWTVTRPLPAVTISTGDFAAEAEWVREPDLTGLFPGDTVFGTARISLDSPAQWRYSVEYSMGGELAPHMTAQWYADAECTGEALAMGESSGGAHTEFCIAFTLSETAPSSLQGQVGDAVVTVTAEQVRP